MCRPVDYASVWIGEIGRLDHLRDHFRIAATQFVGHALRLANSANVAGLGARPKDVCVNGNVREGFRPNV